MKSIKKYLKRRIKTIDFILNMPKRVYTPSTFHKLRIEIKKLNAFFDLLKFCSKDFNKEKMYKPFKLIFRKAGNVRELQIKEAMLKIYFPINFLNEYRNSLKQSRLKEKEKYFSIANKKLSAKLRKKYREIAPYVSQIDENKVHSFMEYGRELIEELMNKNSLQPTEIHTLRKQLKRFKYIRKRLDLGKQNNSHPDKDILPELLGKWHDSQGFVKYLESARDTIGVNPAEERQLEKIRAEVISDVEILLYKINKAIPKSEFFTKEG